MESIFHSVVQHAKRSVKTYCLFYHSNNCISYYGQAGCKNKSFQLCVGSQSHPSLPLLIFLQQFLDITFCALSVIFASTNYPFSVFPFEYTTKICIYISSSDLFIAFDSNVFS